MATSTPKDGKDPAPGPMACPAPMAPPQSQASAEAPPYLTLCASCHRTVALSPAEAVLAEARAVIGDLTVVFCGDCIGQATARMVDGA